MKKVVLMYLALVLFVYNSKAQNAVDFEQRIKNWKAA